MPKRCIVVVKEKLYVYHHLGLGDHVCLNGMVRKLAEKNDIALFCKIGNLDAVRFMYRDADNIDLVPILNEEEVADRVAGKFLKIGWKEAFAIGRANPNMTCDEWFYTQAGIDYSERWSSFYIQRDLVEEERVYKKLNPSNEPYVFVHDDQDRGYEIDIDAPKIVRNDMTENLFYMGLVIERAEEVHLMESSLKCYVEHLEPIGELFFHNIREYIFPVLTHRSTRHKWTIRG